MKRKVTLMKFNNPATFDILLGYLCECGTTKLQLEIRTVRFKIKTNTLFFNIQETFPFYGRKI